MGVLYSRVNILLSTSITFAFSAVLTAAVPHVTVLWPLLLIFVLNGTCLGFFEAACNVTMLYLWGREAMPFMQALNFMYGSGAMIAPLIAEPFLIVRNESEDSETRNTSIPDIFHPEEVMLVYPYSIAAVILVLCAVTNFILWIMFPDTTEHPSRTPLASKNSNNNNDKDNDRISIKELALDVSNLMHGTEIIISIRQASCLNLPGQVENHADNGQGSRRSENYFRWKCAVLALVFLFMHIYLGLEVSFGSYLPAFVVQSDMRLTKATGAHMTTLFWGMFTFVKVTTIFYIKWIGNQANLLMSLLVMVTASGILKVYGNESETMMWVGVGLIGAGLSSVWGCMFGYLEDLFPVSSLIASLMVVSAMLGEFVFPVIISSFIQTYPQILLWVVLLCSSSMTILFMLIMLICNTKIKGH